jgi:uncharacterized peroxidase-related enzyme
MRLPEIDRGDRLSRRLLIGFISLVARMRLPDAARVSFYHKGFFGAPMGAWTQAAMRGPSSWTVGERELMAALVAKWNACPFCVGAHSAIAAREIDRALVDAALDTYRTSAIPDRLKAALAFLEVMTLRPDALTPDHAAAVREAGVDDAGLRDAIAVCTIFNIITRYAEALDFAMPTRDEFDRAAATLLKRGYA